MLPKSKSFHASHSSTRFNVSKPSLRRAKSDNAIHTTGFFVEKQRSALTPKQLHSKVADLVSFYRDNPEEGVKLSRLVDQRKRQKFGRNPVKVVSTNKLLARMPSEYHLKQKVDWFAKHRERRELAKQRKEQLDKQYASKLILQLQQNQTVERKRKSRVGQVWMALIAATLGLQGFDRILTEWRDAGPQREVRSRCARVIQRQWRKRALILSGRRKDRVAMLLSRTMRSFHYVCRGWLRIRAAKILKTFLKEIKLSGFARQMKRLRYRLVYMQRAWRSRMAMRSAQRRVLSMQVAKFREQRLQKEAAEAVLNGTVDSFKASLKGGNGQAPAYIVEAVVAKYLRKRQKLHAKRALIWDRKYKAMKVAWDRYVASCHIQQLQKHVSAGATRNKFHFCLPEDALIRKPPPRPWFKLLFTTAELSKVIRECDARAADSRKFLKSKSYRSSVSTAPIMLHDIWTSGALTPSGGSSPSSTGSGGRDTPTAARKAFVSRPLGPVPFDARKALTRPGGTRRKRRQLAVSAVGKIAKSPIKAGTVPVVPSPIVVAHVKRTSFAGSPIKRTSFAGKPIQRRSFAGRPATKRNSLVGPAEPRNSMIARSPIHAAGARPKSAQPAERAVQKTILMEY